MAGGGRSRPNSDSGPAASVIYGEGALGPIFSQLHAWIRSNLQRGLMRHGMAAGKPPFPTFNQAAERINCSDA